MAWLWVIPGGILAGILINYFSDVLPVSRTCSKPACPACGHLFLPKDYLLLKKCTHCGKREKTRLIIVLIGSVLASILLKIMPFAALGFWASFPLIIFLSVIIVIDFEHRLVLLETSVFGFVLCLVYGLILHGLKTTLLGALGGFLIMLSFYLMGKGLTRVIGWIKHQQIDTVAFGFGDVTLGTILGLLTGWPLVVGAIVITMLAFVVFSLGLFAYLLITKKYRAFSSTLPFTLFLVIGAIAILYF